MLGGQVGALSSLSHFNAVSKQSSWFDSLLLSCWADQCHGGVQVPWGGECLIYKVVWADGLCQLLSRVRTRIQGSSAEYCTVARRQRWYLFLPSAVPRLPWWGHVEGAPSLQLVHKNHPRKAHKENPTALRETNALCCLVLEWDALNCGWWSRGGRACGHTSELLPPDRGEATWWPPHCGGIIR